MSSATSAHSSLTATGENSTQSADLHHDVESLPPQSGEKPAQDPNIVEWEEDDEENPRTWATVYKAWITFLLGTLAMAASLGSSIIAPAQSAIAAEFDISLEVTVFAVSLYVLGFALGPMLWAPISEIWGRRWSLLPAVFCLAIFSIGTAVSTTAEAIFITRFFSGIFGSAPVSNVSAAMGDLYEPKARGMAITFYAVCVVGGPIFGPVIGSALTIKVNWRWTEYVEAIWVFFVFVVEFICLPELYGPVLLAKKARRLRKLTGNDKIYHPHENMKLDPKTVVTKYFTRPVRMLVTENMVTAIAFYASFVYALLYMTLEVFPIVFIQMRGESEIRGSLPFLAIFVGILCAVAINLGNQHFYYRAVLRAGGRAVPEARLPPMQIGSFLFCGGLFWFGWTATPEHHWILPCIAAALIGAGFNTIFQQCINFLVDTYAVYAASAVAANTILRSVFAAGLPFAVRPMFAAMGVGPAMSVLGAIAACMIPVPFLFKRYGLVLRRRSTFAPADYDL